MNPTTLAALQDSIEHWRRMAEKGTDGKDIPVAGECGLCKEFLFKSSKYSCDGCPIRELTGRDGCIGTPYEKANDIFWKVGRGYYNEDFKLAAQRELDFLISLLPPATEAGDA